MEGENGVKLHGMRASTYSKRVELALLLEGVRYEYAAEDLSKSELLEYIDETWNSAPHILPEDPYGRADVRFQASYIQQQLFEGTSQEARSQGEAQEKALEEVFARLGVFEEGMDHPHGGDSIINGEIRASWTYRWLQRLALAKLMNKLVKLLQFVEQTESCSIALVNHAMQRWNPLAT